MGEDGGSVEQGSGTRSVVSREEVRNIEGDLEGKGTED